MERASNIKTGPKDRRTDILNVLYETWRDEAKGQKIIGCWLGGIVVASIWGIYIRRRLRNDSDGKPPPITRRRPVTFLSKNQENSEREAKDPEDDLITDDDDDETPQELSPSPQHLPRGDHSAFSRVFGMGFPSLLSSPVLWSALLSTSLVWRTSNVSAVNDSIGAMGELLVNKKWKLLSHSTMDFAVRTVWASIAISTVDLLSNLLTLSLRDNLTVSLQSKYHDLSGTLSVRHLHRTKAAMEDIECRITTDVAQWARAYTVCFVSFSKPLIDAVLYSQKLTARIGARSFAQCIFYFLASSLWTRSVMPSQRAMKEKVAEFEAKYQRNNGRVVEWVEEIHFLRGIATEQWLLEESYSTLSAQLQSVAGYDFVAALSRNYVVRYLGILAAFVSLLPMVRGESEPTQFLLNNLHDLVNIGLAFRDLMRSAKELQAVKGVAVRIADLSAKLELELAAQRCTAAIFQSEDDDDRHFQGGRSRRRRREHGPNNDDIYKDDTDSDDDDEWRRQREAVRFEKVRLESPEHELLLDGLDWTICIGHNVLVCGPNGAGKSSLFRAVSGLWPCSAGRIRLTLRSDNDDVGFLPSRCYLVPGLSVKEQILYPDIRSEAVSDEAAIEILSECGLGKLVHFVDGVDSQKCPESFWVSLSDGEKQLIALCRAVLKKPKLLFIDEALSALSQDRIHWFFKKLEALSITAVTITHCPDDIALYHRSKLTLSGDGSGSFRIEEI